jgi:hypothetical protein
MYHVVLHRIKQRWREANLELAHSHSYLFMYLIQFTKVDYLLLYSIEEMTHTCYHHLQI